MRIVSAANFTQLDSLRKLFKAIHPAEVSIKTNNISALI
jgi:hypothetical protein